MHFQTILSHKAAALSAAIFLVVAAFQIYWAFGGPWGLNAVWGGTYSDLPARLQFASGVSAVVMVAAGIIVVGRTGLCSVPIPFGVLRWGTRILVVLMTLSALANFASSSNWEQFLNGPVALLQAILCLIIARSAEPER